jgi:hypothetical protein
VTFSVFFDVAAYYSGIVRLEGANASAQMFSQHHTVATFPDVGSPAASQPARAGRGDGAAAEGAPPRVTTRWSWRGLSSAIAAGITHIWSGADHMLFLLALLMTSVLDRVGGRWTPRADLRRALTDVAKIVTGFTLTHSVTLSLAALGLLRPAACIIEPAIAASVAIAAVDNLRPILRGRKWIVAASLGLLHGFGFASGLDDLGLPRDALIVTLCGFALGVEAGQFIFVAAFVPVAFALRETTLYRRWFVGGGSVVITLVALVWMVQRAAPRGP